MNSLPIQKQVLDKAISKAIQNGYDDIHLIEYAFSTDGHLGNLAKYGLICSPGFAKAFWGNWDKGDHPDNCENEYGEIVLQRWQFHLQQMVISDNPIKYLEQGLSEVDSLTNKKGEDNGTNK